VQLTNQLLWAGYAFRPLLALSLPSTARRLSSCTGLATMNRAEPQHALVRTPEAA
jgi:hypothetical protein